MKKLTSWLMIGAWLGLGTAHADGWKELMQETEGKIIDWAIANTVEAGYARDMIGGRNCGVAQIPIVYVSPYLNADFGYVSGYDDKSRGSLMVGGTLRINRLIEDAWKGDLSLVKGAVGQSRWDKLWIGPWVAHGFTAGEVLGGIKGGLKFDTFAFWK